MGKEQAGQVRDTATMRSMLRDAGYSDKAVSYYLETPHLGIIEDADQVSEMTGTCGDTIKVYLKIENDCIADVKYQIMGCPGSISAAMAAGDLVRIGLEDPFGVGQLLPVEPHIHLLPFLETLYELFPGL